MSILALMKAPTLTIKTIKEKLNELKGQKVDMQVCRGRKQVSKYIGIMEDTYASVFVVKIEKGSVLEKLSYSYSDILCGDVVVLKSEAL